MVDAARLAAGALLLALVTAVATPAAAEVAEQVEGYLQPASRELPVNTTIEGDQQRPQVAVREDGSFVVVWRSSQDDGASSMLFARLFLADGSPSSGEIPLLDDPVGGFPQLRVAPLPGGGFVVAWVRDGATPSDPARVYFRLFAADGSPLRGELPVATPPAGVQQSQPAVAVAEDGFLIAWTAVEDVDEADVMGRLFTLDGEPAGAPTVVSQITSETQGGPAVTYSPAFGYAVAWSGDVIHDNFGIALRYFDTNGQPLTVEIPVSTDLGKLNGSAKIGSTPDGTTVVSWLAIGGTVGAVNRLRRFDATGSPISGERELPRRDPLTMAVDREGNVVLVGPDAVFGDELAITLLDDGDARLEEDLTVNTFSDFNQQNAAVAVNGNGEVVVAWESGYQESPIGVPLPPPPGAAEGQDGDGFGVYARLYQRPQLVAPGPVRFHHGRFEVEVAWRRPGGAAQLASPVRLSSDTAYFWFGRPENPEVLIKVIDGRPVNLRYWVFWAGLSDLRYSITVRDRARGLERTYLNPRGTLASGRDLRTFFDDGLLPFDEAAGAAPGLASEPAAAKRGVATEPRLSPPFHCVGFSGPEVCLHDNRFAVSVDWHDPRSGRGGRAQARQLTNESGVFYFTNPDNLEVIVKVIDGRRVNGHWWVFFATLSDVELTVEVERSDLSERQVYEIPAGVQPSVADLLAFPEPPP